MIFNNLKMENIRSHEFTQIKFPKGTSLFEGDVGSGKSTILMAIEFALFGLGNQRGDALLRKGSKMGSVLLDFSVGEKDYQIKRTLIKNDKDSIRQDKCMLGINGKKIQLSPSETKERILDILNFKEPLNPRAQSVIFRYAIYTPQEEMKSILSQKPDIRLQTLRKAFGIEDYKTAAENATTISRLIKGKTDYLSGQTVDLPDKKNSLTKLHKELAENEVDLEKFTEKKDKLEIILKGQKKDLDELKEQESGLKSTQAQIPLIEKQLEDKLGLKAKYEKEIQSCDEENQERLIPDKEKLEKIQKPTEISEESLKEKIKNIKESMTRRGRLDANLTLLTEDKQKKEAELKGWLNRDISELEKEKETLNQKITEEKNQLKSHESGLKIVIKKKHKLEAQMDDINKKLENIDGLGDICPICGSLLDEKHKKNLKQEREKEIRRSNSEITILKEVEKKGNHEIEQKQTEIIQFEKDLMELKSIIEKFAGLIEIKDKIKSIAEQIENIDENLSINIGENIVFENFEAYIKHLEDLSNNLKEYKQAQETLQRTAYQLNRNIEKINENRKGMEKLNGEIEELKASISLFIEKIRELPDLKLKIEEKQSQYNDTEEKFNKANENVITLKTLIKKVKQEILDLKDEIENKERLSKQLDKLNDYYIWLNDYLIPTLSVIEKQVMANIHLEFNDNFQKWFNLMIDDPSKTGRIDEEFTPLVEQDGFQQEINYLSGGEKTSIALAYRVALNNVVQKVSTGMKSNLLIMDEPTDGFSKEQLFKIREILSELNYPQIIIVSHEKELESFADNIFQIEKSEGISEVVNIT